MTTGADPGVVRLPAPRTPGTYAIALVCLGNICRSPIAEVVLRARVDEGGLADRVRVASAGTGDWHVGDPMDPRAAATLLAGDYDPTGHLARQFRADWLDEYDLVLAMDSANLATITEGITRGPAADARETERADEARVRLFRDFDPIDPGNDVPDPYYGGPDGFEEVLTMVERTAAAIVAALQRGERTGRT